MTDHEADRELAAFEAQLRLDPELVDSSARMFPRTDLGNAERFLAMYGRDVHYLPAWKKWILWDGQRWKVDDMQQVIQLAKHTVRAIYLAAPKLSRTAQRRELVAHAVKSEQESRIMSMIRLAGAACAIAPDQLDADPWLLGVANGTLELKTGKLRPHRRADLITKISAAAYDLDADCPRWLQFLDTLTGGDVELINFLQRAIGYSLTGDTSERVLFFLFGSGRNGKSKFLEVLGALLARYAASADSRSFLERTGDGPLNDIARLHGARLVTSSELGEGKRLNEALVKRLTGDETMTARFLYAEEFEFKPAFKVWLAANHRPVIRGTDKGIWDRIRLVPLTVRIPDDQVDRDLFAKLTAELPGIMAWAVGGCVLWQKHGLGSAKAIREATEEYRQDSDIIGAFLEDSTELGDDYETPGTVLYKAYVRWCVDNGERPATQTTFGIQLQERGLQPLKRGGLRYRLGVRLAADAGLPNRTELADGRLELERLRDTETDEDASPPTLPGVIV